MILSFCEGLAIAQNVFEFCGHQFKVVEKGIILSENRPKITSEKIPKKMFTSNGKRKQIIANCLVARVISTNIRHVNIFNKVRKRNRIEGNTSLQLVLHASWEQMTASLSTIFRSSILDEY